ncbi:MAG: hypothetical protein H7A05_10285 [Pseudomonadales bacterium]|nr:hypothetical protein [Pseudomonadales bacterium]MCP5329824.1 hypothetical protein [Pseudomonadales bacterium]MCP5345000.1 hypothetical protein [Pseudomonadales bacterium]
MQDAHDSYSVPLLVLERQVPFIREDYQTVVEIIAGSTKSRSFRKICYQAFQSVDIKQGLAELAFGFAGDIVIARFFSGGLWVLEVWELESGAWKAQLDQE